MNGRIGIGVIGAGVIFAEHAAALECLRDRAQVVALAELDDARREAATTRHFIPAACTDYRELIARDDVDLIDICTPPCCHEEMVTAAVRAGKFVMCEKPLAHTLASADRMLELDRDQPGRISIIHQLRFQGEHLAMTRANDAGLLGRLRLGTFKRLANLETSAGRRSGWWGDWRVAGGGVAMTQFIHHFDQICCLFGRPTEITATMATLKQPIDSEDSFSASIRFKDGALVHCFGSVAAQHVETRIDLIGEDGSLHIPWATRSGDRRTRRQLAALTRGLPLVHRGSVVRRGLRALGRHLGQQRHQRRDRAHTAYFHCVLDAIDAGDPLPISVSDARRSLELCIGVYQSALTRRTVALPLGPDSPFYHGITVDDFREARDSRCLAPAGT